MKTQLKTILTAAAIVIAQLFAPPALAADDGHPTGFDVGAEIAFANFDCPAGLTCPAAEGNASQVYPGGMPDDILVAQSGSYEYDGNELDGYFLDTLAALNSLALMEHYYHLAEFHPDDGDVQEWRNEWRKLKNECVSFINSALASLNAHQRNHNLEVSREHPTVSCPSE